MPRKNQDPDTREALI